MAEELSTEKARLLNELASAQFIKIQALKISAFEQVLFKKDIDLYKEYETKFNSLKEADQGLKEIGIVIKQLQDPKLS